MAEVPASYDNYDNQIKEQEYQVNQQIQVKKFQKLNFIILFLFYGAAHGCRTAWSDSSSTFEKTGPTSGLYKNQGFINMTFLMCYSLGMSTGSKLGEILRLERYLGIGFFCASVSIIIMSIFGNQDFEPIVPIVYIFMGLNGLFQSVGMPGCCATLGNWFSTAQRGAVVGLWAGCQNFGDIVGFIVAGNLTEMENPWSWGWVMILFSSLMMIMAIVAFLFLRPYPEEVDVYQQDIETEDARKRSMSLVQNVRETVTAENKEKFQNLNFISAFLIPGVPIYVIIFCCIKSVNYGLLFWLPTFLKQTGGEDSALSQQSGYIASMMDVGAFFGGILLGQVTDKYQKRALFLMPTMAVSCGFMVIINYVLGTNAVPYYFVILAIGLTFGGCYNMVGSTITLDLAKQPAIANNPDGQTTVNSVINGSAAFCAALFQQLIKAVGDQVFFTFMITAAICTIVMIPLFIKDLKDFMGHGTDGRDSLLENSASDISNSNNNVQEQKLKSIKQK